MTEVQLFGPVSPLNLVFCTKKVYVFIIGMKVFHKTTLVPFLQTLVEELRRLFEKYFVKIQEFKKANQCRELVPISELNGVISFCRLFDCLATPDNGVSLSEQNLWQM